MAAESKYGKYGATHGVAHRTITNLALRTEYEWTPDHRIPYTHKPKHVLFHGGSQKFDVLKPGRYGERIYATPSQQMAEEFAVGKHGGGAAIAQLSNPIRLARGIGYVHTVDPKGFKYSVDDVALFAHEEGYVKTGKTKPIGGYYVKRAKGGTKRIKDPMIKPGQEKYYLAGAAAVAGAGYGAYYWKKHNGHIVRDKQRTIDLGTHEVKLKTWGVKFDDAHKSSKPGSKQFKKAVGVREGKLKAGRATLYGMGGFVPAAGTITTYRGARVYAYKHGVHNKTANIAIGAAAATTGFVGVIPHPAARAASLSSLAIYPGLSSYYGARKSNKPYYFRVVKGKRQRVKNTRRRK